ncbi:MAG: DUF2935 domain-containing protein [Clostridia bacterium]|nr:DUF2935 domain-containing protein [Clostridia bacterium]
MQFYYGEKMPLRVLDEAEFWKLQESEHTVVIRKIVPNLEKEFVRQLENWQLLLSQAQAAAVRLIEEVIRSGSNLTPMQLQRIMQYIEFALRQSQQFVMFLNQMSAQSAAIRSNPIAQTVVSHIIRESEYFIGIAQASLSRHMS